MAPDDTGPVVRLDLRRQGLTRVPAEVFEHADTLEVLDLSGNRLDSLPLDMTRLQRLKILFCSDNLFTELPPVLGRLPALEMVGFKANRISHVEDAALPARLRWLILTDNVLSRLPDSLGRCLRLQKLMLAGNRLRALPPGISQCRALELLRLSANAFERDEDALPDGLLALPRLSWLAYAGNPFCETWGPMPVSTGSSAADAIGAVPWDELDIGERLGEGASGTIHAAQWRRSRGASMPVAVKLFKGAVTSDGLPRSEMQAHVAAGRHEHLVCVHGPVAGHPQGLSGLVMDRIPDGYAALAEPPSFESCTRDVYPPDRRWSPVVAGRMIEGARAALAHLHRRDILHGDLYAHNLLVNDQGRVSLSDFGAASPLPPVGHRAREPLMALDRRAGSVLADEIHERVT